MKLKPTKNVLLNVIFHLFLPPKMKKKRLEKNIVKLYYIKAPGVFYYFKYILFYLFFSQTRSVRSFYFRKNI